MFPPCLGIELPILGLEEINKTEFYPPPVKLTSSLEDTGENCKDDKLLCPPRSDITEFLTSEVDTMSFSFPPVKQLKVLKGLHIIKGSTQPRAEYNNYSDLVEVVRTLLLPHGEFKNLKIILDIGATRNFVNTNLVNNAKILLDVSKSLEAISISDGAETKSSGETKPITMKIGRIFKHTCTYTVMNCTILFWACPSSNTLSVLSCSLMKCWRSKLFIKNNQLSFH